MKTPNDDRYLTSHRAVREALRAGQGKVLHVAAQTPVAKELSELARANGVLISSISRTGLRSLETSARDVALELSGAPEPTRSLDDAAASSSADAVAVMLDHIEDPRNYGAILRSADQFGASFVIVPGRRAAPLSAVAIEASAGTAQAVSIVTVPNLATALADLKLAGFWAYAAAMDGPAAHTCNLSGKVCLIMGNEGKGVSRLLLDRSDQQISIPRTGSGDSLNVSVAAGVLLYEVRRQQGWLDRRR